MRVNSVANLARGTEMRARILELARAHMHDDEIAAILTSEGHRSPNCVEKVLPITVQRIRLRAGVKQAEQRTCWQHPPDILSAQELAGRLNIPGELALCSDQKGPPSDRSPTERRASVREHAQRHRGGSQTAQSRSQPTRSQNQSA
jgi:hypothetical protein